MFTVDEFAARHRLRVRRDACGDRVVSGKIGHISQHSLDGRTFCVVFEEPASGPSRARLLLSRRRAAIKAGFKLHQASDVESILLFDPADEAKARVAIRLVGAKRKRNVQVSAASLANLVRGSTRTASQPLGATQSAD